MDQSRDLVWQNGGVDSSRPGQRSRYLLWHGSAMMHRVSQTRSNLGGIFAVGAGAIVGTIVGIFFLVMKNSIGLLGPIIGAAVGGYLYRRASADNGKPETTLEDGLDAETNTSVGSRRQRGHAIGLAVAFLVLGPLGAATFCWIMQGRDVGEPPFGAVLLFGTGAFPFCARNASIASTAFPEFSVGGRWSTVLK